MPCYLFNRLNIFMKVICGFTRINTAVILIKILVKLIMRSVGGGNVI